MKKIIIFSFMGLFLFGCNRSSDYYYEQGNKLHLSGRYLEAVEMFSKALMVKKNYPEALNSRGLTYEKLKDKQKAENDFKRAIEYSPDYMPSYANLSGMYMDSSNYQNALYYLNKAIRKKPDYAYAYLNRGIISYKINDSATAFQDLSKTIELDDKLELAFYYRAIVLNSLGRPIEALDDLNNLIKINDKISLAYYERGKIKFRLKDYASAVKDFKASVDLMPNGVYHYWTALASYRMRYYEGALNQVQESIKLMPEFAVAHLLQGDISFSMRDYRRSRASYMKTKELDPDNAEIYDKRLRTVNRRIRKARR